MSRLKRVALFDMTHDGQQLGSGDVDNRTGPEPRKYVSFEKPEHSLAVAGRPVISMLLIPLPRDDFEAVR